MAQVRVQKFLMEASDMARWQAGTVVFAQLSQFSGIPVETQRFVMEKLPEYEHQEQRTGRVV